LSPFEKTEKNSLWANELRFLTKRIKEKKVVIFNSEKPVETMFYTNFTAYSGIPDSTTINKFISRGYTAYIYQTGFLTKLIPTK
jgi:hypothetical protein